VTWLSMSAALENSDPSLNLMASGLDEEVTPEIPRKPSSAAATLSAYDARDS
jgi:hypothetical protein